MKQQIRIHRAEWFKDPTSGCQPLLNSTSRAWRIVLLGAPGVGKGTQGDLLSRRLEICHLSTGDLFRAAQSQSDGHRTAAITEAMKYMQRGELVPDSTVWQMVRERSNCMECPSGFLLDGFPRTVFQAEQLKVFMEDRGLKLNAVVEYEMSIQDITERLGGRRVCHQCTSSFHITERPSKKEHSCDDCGGQLYQREDDQPHSIQIRLKTYKESTMPLIQFYRELGILFPIDATGSPDEILAKTMTALESKPK